jgi:hypothetical protein
VRAEIEVVHLDAPSRRPQNAREGPERGGLAGAVRPDETDDLSAGDAERQAVDGGKRSVCARELVDNDGPGESLLNFLELRDPAGRL